MTVMLSYCFRPVLCFQFVVGWYKWAQLWLRSLRCIRSDYHSTKYQLVLNRALDYLSDIRQRECTVQDNRKSILV